MQAERLLAAGAELAEGPVWDTQAQEVVWVDVLAGQINRLSLSGQVGSPTQMSTSVGALAFTATNSWLAATPDGLCRLDDRSLVVGLPLQAPDLRMNDGKVDPQGRFVGGTMTTGRPRKGAGSLWSFGGAGVRMLVDGVTISNGLAWSADGCTMFYVDTPTQRIDAFDYDPSSGVVANRRPWAHIPSEMGAPDGMCIDVEGGLWVALWGGSAVVRLIDGTVTERIEVPTPQVTCPAFVGPKLDQLVITTAAIGLDPCPEGAGDLYICTPGVAGTLPNPLGSWAN
ncbi:MAG TPA: SMP-30/gluconolactonase/LRE family protein [Acidimicrobiia bacterium]|jgi:sugar lactone lactonase YvrE|nr:SMP-30/gluconolactonase/LRE family protein [Acidimicrobiia bacterium]